MRSCRKFVSLALSANISTSLLRSVWHCSKALFVFIETVHHCFTELVRTSRVPVEGKSSVCLIFMKYRIIILIIIITSLGHILLSIANTSCTHAHTRMRTDTHTAVAFRSSLFDGSVVPNHEGPFRWQKWLSPLHSNKHTRGQPVLPRFCVFLLKLLGRTETRTRDRMCFQSIRTVWDISQDDRAIIATCSLLTATDRLKENYTIDTVKQFFLTLYQFLKLSHDVSTSKLQTLITCWFGNCPNHHITNCSSLEVETSWLSKKSIQSEQIPRQYEYWI